VVCPAQELQNGFTNVDNATAPSVVAFNDTLAASCQEGFHLVGADRLICGKKQEFDERFPKCINGTGTSKNISISRKEWGKY
jgi:hypothetical protein